jgi:hypothetical protein
MSLYHLYILLSHPNDELMMNNRNGNHWEPPQSFKCITCPVQPRWICLQDKGVCETALLLSDTKVPQMFPTIHLEFQNPNALKLASSRPENLKLGSGCESKGIP